MSRLTLHCPPGLTPHEVRRLGRVGQMPWFGVVNRVLGWVVLAGQFTAIGMFASFAVIALFGDVGVLRVLWSALVVGLGWVAYRLMANFVRLAVWRRVLDIRLLVWSLGFVVALVVGCWAIARGEV